MSAGAIAIVVEVRSAKSSHGRNLRLERAHSASPASFRRFATPDCLRRRNPSIAFKREQRHARNPGKAVLAGAPSADQATPCTWTTGPIVNELVLLAHLGATLALVGLIWTVQVDLYPLFARVGRAAFREYHAAHTARITVVVLPLMATELVTGAMLVFSPPDAMARLPFVIAFGGILLAWASTVFIQVPLHGVLGEEFSAEAQGKLVTTNWLRTFSWTARGLFVLWVLHSLLSKNP